MFGRKDMKLDAVIGGDTLIKGEIVSTGTVRIDGRLEGNLKADCVIVGESGFIDGDVVARSVIAGGKVKGNIRASESVEVQPKGEVYGDISATRLTVAEGAVFEGRSSMQKTREIDYKPQEEVLA